MKKEYLSGLGIKVRDLGKGAVERIYNEFIEYGKSGTIP